MTSLTTLFVVGPEEYVEFNESMGSKAFLEHVWDESVSPLQRKDTSAAGVQLHSAGARIAGKPPRIEFPTVLRQRGNKFKASGRFISWDELWRLNPLAIAPPPDLAEFEKRGAKVGVGEQVKPGAWLEHKRVKVEVGADGWYGKGAAESVYAATQEELEADAKEAQALAAETANSTDDEDEERARTPKATGAGTSHRKSGSKSLFERLGMDAGASPETTAAALPAEPSVVAPEAEPAPAPSSTTLPATVISAPTGDTPPSKRRTASTLRIPMPISTMTSFSMGEANGALPTPTARTPLSATHPPPDTPLKHLVAGKRAGASELTPLTPSAESLWSTGPSAAERSPSLNGRAKGLGLGGVDEDQGGSPRSPVSTLIATPPNNFSSLPPARGSSEIRRSPLSSYSTLSVSPSRAANAASAANAGAASSSPPTAANGASSQIEAMLQKLRLARTTLSSGAGTASSRWATSSLTPAAPSPPAEEAEAKAKKITVAVEPTKRQRAELKSAEAQTSPLDAEAEARKPKAGPSKAKLVSPTASKAKAAAGVAEEPCSPSPDAAAAPPQLLGASEAEAEGKAKTGKQRRIRGRGRSQGAQDAAANGQVVEAATAPSASEDATLTPTPGRRDASSSAFTEEFSAATTASFGVAPAPTAAPAPSESAPAKKETEEGKGAAEAKLAPALRDFDVTPATSILEARHLQVDTPPQEESACTTPTPESVAAAFPDTPAEASAEQAVQTEPAHVDWADDDDDDSLPDLPEEWGTPTPSRSLFGSGAGAGMTSSSSAPALSRAAMPPTPTRNGAASDHASEGDRASKRGSKRGGKQRNKKAKEAAAAANQAPLTPSHVPEESRAARASSEPPRDMGLRIAGRAASNVASPTAPRSSGAPPIAPAAARGQAPGLGIRIAGTASGAGIAPAPLTAPSALGQEPPKGPRADRLRGQGSAGRPPPHMAALHAGAAQSRHAGPRSSRSAVGAPPSPAMPSPVQQHSQSQPPTPRSGGRPRLAAGGEGTFARLAGGILGASGGGGGGRRGGRRGSAAGAGAAA